MNQLALSGIKVLDLSQLIAGPSATSMLAELGADVIKLESLDGDIGRGMGRFRKKDLSSTFTAYNKGKRSIALNLRSSDGQAVARKLIRNSDVLVEAFRPGVMDRFGLSYEAVKEINPKLVYVSFTGFGHEGPMANRPGVDLVVQGESGIMSVTGETEGEPMKVGFTAVDAAAGFAIGQAILAGLVRRMTQGVGSLVQLNLLDIALYMQAVPFTEYLMTGEEPVRSGNKAPLGSPAELFYTADGALIISAYFQSQWPELCNLLDLPDLIKDSRFNTNSKRIENRPELHPILQEKFLTANSAEWKSRLASTRIIFGDVLKYSQVVEQEQVVHNEAIIEVDSEVGQLKSVGAPFRVSGTEQQRLSVANLGQHGDDILGELGFSESEVNRLRREGNLL